MTIPGIKVQNLFMPGIAFYYSKKRKIKKICINYLRLLFDDRFIVGDGLIFCVLLPE